MIKVLQILTHLKSGGAEAVVYNYYSHIDRSKVHFDIVALYADGEQLLAPKFASLGANIFYLPKNPIKRLRAVKRIISNGNYDIVHSHCEFLSELYLLIAKCCGVNVRIMHSHIANSKLSFLKRTYRPFGRLLARYTASDFFACGRNAAISLWGKKNFNRGRCYIVNNAIDLDRFRFSGERRNNIRKIMGWTDKHIIVNVGRLNYQKNHEFILNVFSGYQKYDKKALLVLVGEGELEGYIKNVVMAKGLSQSVIMLGRRDDVPELLNACDCFLLPSLFEGLPVVAIESQANGLPIIMSDSITDECGLSDIAAFLPLSAPINEWGDEISKMLSNKQYRADYNKIISDAGFDINKEAARLLNKYTKLLAK